MKPITDIRARTVLAAEGIPEVLEQLLQHALAVLRRLRRRLHGGVITIAMAGVRICISTSGGRATALDQLHEHILNAQRPGRHHATLHKWSINGVFRLKSWSHSE